MTSILSSVESSGDDIYYDITIKNLGNNESRDDIIPLVFDEQRTAPIVQRASDYRLSVVRFQLDTFSLPVFIADILPNQGNVSLMTQTLTMVYRYGPNPTDRRYITTDNLRWQPADETQPLPPAPNTTPSGFQVITPYYYAFDYEHVIKIVNDGLAEALDDLKLDALANPLLYPPDFQDLEPPFFGWNQDTRTATLYSRTIFNTANTTPTLLNPLIELYFGPTLYSMFNSLPITKKLLRDGNNEPVFSYPYYQIMIDNFNGYRTIQGLFNQQTERFIQTPQQYSTITEWSPVSSLMFTSSTLPVLNEQLSEPKLTFNNNVVQLNRPGNSFANIITDFITDEDSYRGSLLYFPTAQYRYISLLTDQPISQVDLQVYYRLKQNGVLIPFTLPSGGSASLKLLFERRKIE